MPPRSDNRKEIPEDATFVERHEAVEYGYWGQTPDTSDDTQYHVTGTEEPYLESSSRQSSASTTSAQASQPVSPARHTSKEADK